VIINEANLNAMFNGFKATYKQGFEGAASQWSTVAMKVPSSTEKETYGWLGQLPGMREWIGDREIKNLIAKGFTVENRDFEMTVGVPRNKIEDDLYGIYTPFVADMGRAAAARPDELVFSLLAKGWTEACYDGQNFFDTDHPVKENGEDVSVANTDGGTGEPWYLLDTSRAIRPLIFQERRTYDFNSLTDPSDENVFMRKEYIYGVDARGAAGFGLWQLAWGSRQELTSANYAIARKNMQTLTGDEGRPLGIKPTVLVVGPNNEQAALKLINATTLENGESNEWHNTVQIVVTPWVKAS
tara:strand:- start:863 stop:1759 length:897 start_codon:yes stop_codon:yes gene_type:complete